MVPKSRAETPTTGGNRPFPEGSWIGTIEETRVRNFPDWVDPVGRPKGGYTSTDGDILSIQLGNNRDIDGNNSEVGNQKMFVDFVVRDGAISVEDAEIAEAAWQTQRAQTLLANLALALGATSTVTDDDGNEFVVTSEDFLSTLMSGGYANTEVGFTTYHRNWECGGKSGTNVVLREFFQAV